MLLFRSGCRGDLDIADYIEPSMEKWLMITDMMYMCAMGSGEMEISAI